MRPGYIFLRGLAYVTGEWLKEQTERIRQGVEALTIV